MPPFRPSATATTVVADQHTFLESPRWRDGRLFASDFHSGRVLAFAPDGTHEVVCTLDDHPSGLGWTPDGQLLIVAMQSRRLLRRDHDGAIHEVADLRAHTGGATNDMVVDDTGRAYIGNFGWDESADPTVHATSIVRVDPDGTVSVAAEDVVFPNGMAISPDGGTFYVAETFAARITAFDRATDGTLDNRRVWASFADVPPTTTEAARGVLPDGIALDTDGALWVGDAAGGPALRVVAGGHVVDAVAVDGQAPYAVSLGGDDRRTLFLCAATPYGTGADHAALRAARLLSCRVERPGV